MQMLNDNESAASANYQVHKFGSEPHDLCIRIGLQSFNLHRSVVETKSKYFFNVMKMKSLATVTDLVLEDVSADTFLDICRWMYGSQLQIAAHNFCAVWRASKKLQILDLVEKCRYYLSSIGSQHRTYHDQQRHFKESVAKQKIQPQLKCKKTVTFAPETLPTGHQPPVNGAEQHCETEGTPKRKPVSLEKLLSKKTVVNKISIQRTLRTNISDEWLTISEEEIIGSETEDSNPRLMQDKVPATYDETFPWSAEFQQSPKITEHPEMVLVKACEQSKLAFLVDRCHLVLNSEFLKAELERFGRNSVTLRHTDNQTVSNVLQWSLGESRPLTITNVRATWQLTSQLQMAKLSAKCLEFWRKCIRDYAAKAPAEISSAPLLAQARSNWPLLGPYPFLINLVASHTNLPAEAPCIKSRVREVQGHAQIIVKALTGNNPRPPKTINIPSSECIKKVLVDQAPSPSKPVIPASIKILGLRRTLELLNSRKTRSKSLASKLTEPGLKHEPEKKAVPPLQSSLSDSAERRKVSLNPVASNKTVTSLRSLANRRDFARKKTNTDNEFK